MSHEMKVPAVGESITEVTVANWVKKDGDFVEMDEMICELESDKATFELTAEVSGTLKILAEEGSVLNINETICEINPQQNQNSETPPQPQKTTTPTDQKGKIVDMVVPTVGESINEVTVGTWYKKEGDFVELDENLVELESDKATFEFPSEASGILKIVAQEGDTLEIGALLCQVEAKSGSSSPSKSPKTDDSQENLPTPTDSPFSGHASPAAAKILRERGIDPKDVKGTGKDGRITKEDALGFEKKPEKATPTPQPQKIEETPVSPQRGLREEERKKMTSLRKTVSRRLVAVKNETAMLTTFNEVNMKPIMDIRKTYKEEFKEKHEVGLGFMSFFTQAVCVALQEWPAVNAKIDGDEIIYHQYCDISIAVSAPKGLVVPVIRNAEKLDFVGIEKEVIRLAIKARENKLSIQEMEGGTFTLTNGGIFGSMMSTPIINAPQSAILGMHNIVQRPVVENGEVVVRPMMYVALSYDHRIIDGRESVSFLVRVKQLLENPLRLLLGV